MERSQDGELVSVSVVGPDTSEAGAAMLDVEMRREAKVKEHDQAKDCSESRANEHEHEREAVIEE